MAIPVSGPVSILDLATEFGGTAPHSMSEYYRGGGLVPNNNTGVPTSGVISLSDFYGAVAALVLDITSNATAQNILTLATAAGYNASTDTTPIIVNVAAGVDIVGSSGNPGMTTGALNAASDVTINVAATATVCGFDGAQGANGGINTAGSAGGSGTDAIHFAITSGTGTYAVVNSGTVGGGSGGGGGAGGGGSAGAKYTPIAIKGGYQCELPPTYGSNGSSGTSGTSGTSCQAQNGTSGTAGSSGTYAFDPSGSCAVYVSAGSGGAGGAGGTAGKAVNFGGLTVSTSGAGTYYGATS
jgi:hypothetical protein